MSGKVMTVRVKLDGRSRWSSGELAIQTTANNLVSSSFFSGKIRTHAPIALMRDGLTFIFFSPLLWTTGENLIVGLTFPGVHPWGSGSG